MKLAIIGATGLVGGELLKVLESRNFRVDELMVAASEHSVGRCCTFKDTSVNVMHVHDVLAAKPDIAIFSAGSFVSLAYAPAFAEAGTTVIDNSSAWRQDPAKRLIVPEVNAHILTAEDKIIANPNCSTIQLVVALHKLHEKYQLRRIVVSTYQSVTGTGKKAVNQLLNERAGLPGPRAYPHRIDLNAIPHIDVFEENGYTKEEMKMVRETKKIFGDDSIQLTATCVRLPVMGGHSEAVNAEFGLNFTLEEARAILQNTPGVEMIDEPAENRYPMPIDAQNRDEVLVGRLRMDESQPRTLNLWVVADNLRKGAATNAVQIAEYLVEKGLV